MNRAEDTADRRFDLNLRAVAEQMTLPPDPTHEQRARWKRAHREGKTRARRFLRSPLRRWSAIAAAVAIPLIVLSLPRGSVVAADLILDDLQRSCSSGAVITLTNLGADGIRFSGQVLFTADPESAAPILGPSESPSRGRSLTVALEVTAAADTPEIGGFRGRIWLADRDGAQWFYLRADELPKSLTPQEPWMALAARALREGVMIRTDSLFAGIADGLGSLPVISELAGGSPRGTHSPKNSAGLDDLADLFDQLLLSARDSGEVARLLASLERSAGSIRVERVSDGNYRLVARDFRSSGVPVESEGESSLGPELAVQFVSGKGVVSAVLDHVGAYDGTITVVPLSAASRIPALDMPQAGIILDGRP